MYLVLKLNTVCKKLKIMSRPKSRTHSNTNDVSPSNKLKAMVKEEVAELL